MARILWYCRAGSLAFLVSLALPAVAGEPDRPAGVAADGTAVPAQLSRSEAQLLIGRPVEDPQRKRIGRADDLLFDAHGEITAVIVELGGFLGIGERRIAVGRDAFRISPDGPTVIVTMTADQLAQVPTYREPRDPPAVDAKRTAGVR